MTYHNERPRRRRERISFYGKLPGNHWVGKQVPTPAGVQALAGPRTIRLHRGCVHVTISWRPAGEHIPAYFVANVGGDAWSSGAVAYADRLGDLIAYTLSRFKRLVLDIEPDAEIAGTTEYPDL